MTADLHVDVDAGTVGRNAYTAFIVRDSDGAVISHGLRLAPRASSDVAELGALERGILAALQLGPDSVTAWTDCQGSAERVATGGPSGSVENRVRALVHGRAVAIVIRWTPRWNLAAVDALVHGAKVPATADLGTRRRNEERAQEIAEASNRDAVLSGQNVL